jgi:outer membrane protein, heavy metal efflux system
MKKAIYWPLATLSVVLATSSGALGAPPSESRRADSGIEGPLFTLKDAKELLVRTHPLLTAAEQGARATASDAVAAGLWSNPTLSASYANAWNSSYDRAGLFAASLTQFLDVRGAPAARRQALELASKAELAERTGILRDLVAELESRGVGYAYAREAAARLEHYQGRVLEVVRIVQARVSTGAAPAYDADRIAIVDSNAEADRVSAEADLKTAEAAFFASIGPESGQLRGRLDLVLDRGPSLPPLEDLLHFLRSKRPELLAAKARVEASEATVDAAKRSVFPGFALSVGTQFGQAPGQLDLGAGVIIPLPVVDRGQGAVAAARARVAQGQAEVQALLAPAERWVTGLYGEVEARRNAADVYLRRMATAREAMLSEALAGYQGGKLSVLELADAFTSWRDSELRALRLCGDARLAEIVLGRMVGISLWDWAQTENTTEGRK